MSLEPWEAENDWGFWGEVGNEEECPLLVVADCQRCNEVAVDWAPSLLSICQDKGARVWCLGCFDTQSGDKGSIAECSRRASAVDQGVHRHVVVRRNDLGKYNQ
jgi:hypothetical protein